MKEKSYTFIEWVVIAGAKVKKLKAVVRVQQQHFSIAMCYAMLNPLFRSKGFLFLWFTGTWVIQNFTILLQHPRYKSAGGYVCENFLLTYSYAFTSHGLRQWFALKFNVRSKNKKL